VFPAYAQKFSAPFGGMPDAEIREALTMSDYAPEPGTPALGLYRQVRIETNTDGIKLSYLVRTKILKASAFDTWGNEVINVLSDGITTIKGNCYTLVGNQVIKRPLADTDIRMKKLNRSWNQYTMAMPNMSEGCIVEFYYTTMLDFYWLPDWDFQKAIPVLYSEVYLDTPHGGFRADIGGRIEVQYVEIKKKQTHRWHVSNIPSFNEEPYMPNSDLFISSLNLWRYERPWESNQGVIYWRKNFFVQTAGQLSGVREKVKEVTATLTDEKSKIKAIAEFVKQNVAYNDIEDAIAYEYNDILKKKEGSAADINLLLTAMLIRADIQANPVLLRTRNDGHHHEDIPTLNQFNYAIAQVISGKDTLYLDATEKELPYNVLPVRCLNDRGLLITRDVVKWVNIGSSQKRKIIAEGNFNLKPDGSLEGTFSMIRDGYEAADSRKKFKKLGDEYFKNQIPAGWMMSQKKIENEQAPELPLVENYHISIADHTTVVDSRMYINPYIMPYVTSNPFNTDKRLYPIEFDSPMEATLLCNLTLPEGYVVEDLPQSKVMALPGNSARAIFNITANAKQIQIMTRLQINRTFFGAEEYDQLKEFYVRLLAKQGEQIVLKKGA
jgi:hypothetical protein